MSSRDRAKYPDWIPTGEDWFAREALGELDGAQAGGEARGDTACCGHGGTEVVGICFRSWRRMGSWPRDLVAYLSAALSG